jgi:2-polyprenyl-3-methyl-5-hydroxy-6-metoxy-1,4-benzoquinol methylase
MQAAGVQDRRDVYEPVYARMATDDERTRAWRALVSRNNAAAIEVLLDNVALDPRRVLDIGCGDGALLEELARGGGGDRSFAGLEIVESAIALARRREIRGVDWIELFDGARIAEPGDSFDVALLNFVIEHADEPLTLLREAARVASHVVLAVVLDDTLAAHRPAHRREAARIGHQQGFNRASMRKLVADAGLEIVEERVEMPALEVFTFWSEGRAGEARARALGRARRGLHRALPRTAERLVAANYRCIARRAPIEQPAS